MEHNPIFKDLRANPPKLSVKDGAKEVVIKTISAMCDNVSHLRLKKNSDDEFHLSGMGNHLSNWQMKHDAYEIEWKADEGKWDEVLKMINTGTSRIQSVKSR